MPRAAEGIQVVLEVVEPSLGFEYGPVIFAAGGCKMMGILQEGGKQPSARAPIPLVPGVLALLWRRFASVAAIVPHQSEGWLNLIKLFTILHV